MTEPTHHPVLAGRQKQDRQWILSAVFWVYTLFCCLVAGSTVFYSALNGSIFSFAASCFLLFACLYAFSGYLIFVPVVYLSAQMMRKGELVEAERMLKSTTELYKKLKFRLDWSFTSAVSNLAVIKLSTGQFAEAELIYGELIKAISKDKRLARSSLAAVYVNNLSFAHLRQMELNEAHDMAQKALEIWTALPAKERAGQAFPLVNLAEIDIAFGDYPAAREKLQKALDALAQQKLPAAIMKESYYSLELHIRLHMAIVALELGEKEQAYKWLSALRESLLYFAGPSLADSNSGIFRPLGRPPAGYSFAAFTRLIDLLLKQGDAESSKIAGAILEVVYDAARDFPTHPHVKGLQAVFEVYLLNQGREDEIDDMRNWVRPVSVLLLDQGDSIV